MRRTAVWTDKGSKRLRPGSSGIFNLTSKLRAGVIMGGAIPTSFLVASGEDLAARRGARTEHSRSYVRIEATKYGGERPSRSPKDDVGIAPNTYNKFDPTSPFGGYKESGYGREGGLHGLGAYLNLN